MSTTATDAAHMYRHAARKSAAVPRAAYSCSVYSIGNHHSSISSVAMAPITSPCSRCDSSHSLLIMLRPTGWYTDPKCCTPRPTTRAASEALPEPNARVAASPCSASPAAAVAKPRIIRARSDTPPLRAARVRPTMASAAVKLPSVNVSPIADLLQPRALIVSTCTLTVPPRASQPIARASARRARVRPRLARASHAPKGELRAKSHPGSSTPPHRHPVRRVQEGAAEAVSPAASPCAFGSVSSTVSAPTAAAPMPASALSQKGAVYATESASQPPSAGPVTSAANVTVSKSANRYERPAFRGAWSATTVDTVAMMVGQLVTNPVSESATTVTHNGWPSRLTHTSTTRGGSAIPPVVTSSGNFRP
mmetsp:Transcript_10898/g.45186  ORF Transcript_10898/g.45186 Transcript_10898/m.45186 type:complete len:365 (+) Transcript_10898:258-1352(+)